MPTYFRELGGKKCWGGVAEMLLGLGWQNIFGVGSKIVLGCRGKSFLWWDGKKLFGGVVAIFCV